MNETILSEALRDWSNVAKDRPHDGIPVALLAVPDTDAWAVGVGDDGNPAFVAIHGARGMWITCGEGIDMVTSVFPANDLRSGVRDALSPTAHGTHVNHLRTWNFWLDGRGFLAVESRRRTVNVQAMGDPSIPWWSESREVRCQLLAGLPTKGG